MAATDLNVDIGEGMPWDTDLMQIATSVNIGLGEHAGDWNASLHTMHQAKALGLRVGFHPGYPDRIGFGRRPPTPDQESAWHESILSQISRAQAAFEADYLKPHGALYHESQMDGEAARIIIEALRGSGLALMGMPNTFHQQIAIAAEVPFIAEGFAERGYKEGKLIPRGQPGAELNDLDAIAHQVEELRHTVDSICVHGDRKNCVAIATRVRALIAPR